MFGHDFVFRNCFAEAIIKLPQDQQLKAFWAIINYGTNEIIPDEDENCEPYMALFSLARCLMDEDK